MNDTIMAAVINETFPQLDTELKNEIYQKVVAHMFEYLRGKVYEDNLQANSDFQSSLQQISDMNKRTETYVETIIKQFKSLSDEKKKQINSDCDNEMTRVMHQIYQAAN